MKESVATYQDLRRAPLAAVRQCIREGRYTSHTAGLAPGYLQANLAILPATEALDFMRFCQRNPQPCPLVGATDTGDPVMHTAGDIDIRTDLPGYNIYRNGRLDSSTTDITALWRDDFVAFALGCSFTFENALLEAGIPLDHIDNDTTVPMYRTRIATVAAGPFGGGMVVSMRHIASEHVEMAVTISRRYPLAHGAPVHIGDPAAIGITDLAAPDWGDPPSPANGRTPVFWACGVTPQNAILRARLPLCITHVPGRMLITDVSELAEVPVLQPV